MRLVQRNEGGIDQKERRDRVQAKRSLSLVNCTRLSNIRVFRQTGIRHGAFFARLTMLRYWLLVGPRSNCLRYLTIRDSARFLPTLPPCNSFMGLGRRRAQRLTECRTN